MKRLRWTTLILLVLSIALIGAGIFLKEPDIVWRKAVNVCLECIGVG